MENPKFETLGGRTANIDELYGLVADTISKQSTEYWRELFDRIDVPYAPISSFEDLLQDEHLNARGFFETYQHPTEGTIRTTAFPVEFSATPGHFTKPAPTLGQDSRSVLLEAGFDEAEVGMLIASGAIFET